MTKIITKYFISKKSCSGASLLNLLILPCWISLQWIYFLALAEHVGGHGGNSM